MTAQAAYLVIIEENGSVTTEIVKDREKTQRDATTYDIYNTSKELVSDIDSHLLADRIAQKVIAAIQPVDQAKELKERLINALTERKEQ